MVEGRRPKEFCNSSCRSKFWKNEQSKKKKATKVQNLTEPNVEKKPAKQPKSNFAINSGQAGDPKEGSLAFFTKYGVATYAELKTKQ